ncbi:WD40 repeat-like protein [Lophiostoma macrostomum CBS 122681]|uniref:WD40 repeat-like protein n=1 Tax=Lophiostoma macrostomum CBS 122681 TaxID=1314788 RepID=A0A6A6TRI8_9PLEO|nr:WD40 repeat-like protein [Lophiostoma macrostomum CBS 122681]
MSHSDLPSFQCYHRLGGSNSDVKEAWQDVQFYPHTHASLDPVFAVTGTSRNTAVYRCVRNEDREASIELIRWFGDQSQSDRSDIPNPALNSVEWTHTNDGDPLLMVAGANPAINILNVSTGNLVMTLAGHGKLVTELVISPTDHTILASASYDRSIRLWTLDPACEGQRTVAILAGDGGHKFDIIALVSMSRAYTLEANTSQGWHRKGRYLLSGGMDTMVNLWMIPEDEKLKKNLGSDNPIMMAYPHFSSTDIHHDYVDCVKFYNDLIISRAAKENTILLWKIDNFSSNDSPPASPPLPHSPIVQSRTPVRVPVTPLSGTRSAWGGKFQRLLQFEYPQTDPFYMRFGLLHELGMHPVLAAGNTKSKIFFWDLQVLEEAGLGENVPGAGKKKKRDNNRAPTSCGLAVTMAGKKMARESSHTSESSAASDPSNPAHSETSKASVSSKGDDLGATTGIGDHFKSIVPHKTETIPNVSFAIRGMAWSRNGEWLVACGDYGMVAVMDRWGHRRPPSSI